jgi:DNA invertase Pin-like site-specific DNA recombinase
MWWKGRRYSRKLYTTEGQCMQKAPKPCPEKLIGLVRVSTGKQAESGLGLEAQQSAIDAFRLSRNALLIKTYVEVESGKHDDIEDRPMLRAAVAHAKRSGARLVIAKLDRLLRSIPMLAYLKTSNIRFVACDNPEANELTVDILASVAANERRQISTRTREALAAYKAHRRVSRRVGLLHPGGVPPEVVEATAGKLGASLPQCRTLTAEAMARGRGKSARVRRAGAIEAYEDLAGYMKELRGDGPPGGLTLLAIAQRLNEDGHTTRRGKPWNAVQVMRVLRRFEATA